MIYMGRVGILFLYVFLCVSGSLFGSCQYVLFNFSFLFFMTKMQMFVSVLRRTNMSYGNLTGIGTNANALKTST